MAIAMGWQKPDNVAGTSAPAIMVGLFVATGGLLFGYDTGTINGILVMEAFKEQFAHGYRDPITKKLVMEPGQSAIIVAILSLGTFIGALMGAPAADKFGRRLSLILSVLVFCFGVIFQVLASDVPTLLVGRFFAGLGVGAVSLLVPLYQSEMAPKWIRGTLVCAYQLSITLGLLAASVVNILTQKINHAAAYRIPMGLQFTWAAVLTVGLMMLPETPRYLVRKGNKEGAALSLSRLRRLDITHPALVEELEEIIANHDYELTLGGDTYKQCFVGEPRLGRRTLTGCALQMLQQLSGVNFIMYYGTTFFEGVSLTDSFLISLVINIVNVASTIPGLLVIESWGRRKLLIVGAVGMAACQLLIATFSTASGNPTGGHMSTAMNWVLLIFVGIYIFFFAASWGPVTWVVTSEIHPLKVRAKSMSLSTASNWLLNFAIAYGTPYMVGTTPGSANLGHKIFFVWGSFCVVSVAFVWYCVYETSKMSLEQIDELYERIDKAWHSKGFQPSWSFQQMRDIGWSESGIPPDQQQPGQQHEMQTTTGASQPPPPPPPPPPPAAALHPPQSSAGVSVSSARTADSGVSGTSRQSDDQKLLSQMRNVDFSY